MGRRSIIRLHPDTSVALNDLFYVVGDFTINGNDLRSPSIGADLPLTDNAIENISRNYNRIARGELVDINNTCLLYTSPSPRD